jgi:peroxiredoxin Q/BCP
VAEFVAFRDQFAAFAEHGVQVFGISPDSLEDHHRFRERYNLPVDLLSDVDHAVSTLYGVWQTTDIRGKKLEGAVHTSYLIDTHGVVKAVYTHVRGERHAEQVLAALPELLNAPTDEAATQH